MSEQDENSSPKPQTPAIQRNIDLAVHHHKAGRLPEAESIYQEILKTDPNQPVAMHLLGVIAYQAGKSDVAVDLITKAISIKHDFAEAYSNLGIVMKDSGNPISARLGFLISYFKTLGGLNSTQEELINDKGEAVPLLTNSFIHWFETINWSDFTLLELGSGNSTLYFSRHFKFVSSFENNEDWYQKLRPQLPENVNYTYANSIRAALKNKDLDNYDAILIDAGENRAKISRIISETGYSGLIFFDNSEWYKHGIGILSKAGFAEVPFFGIKPVQDWVSCTSVLVKSDCLSNWFTSDRIRLPDLAKPMINNPWDDENESK